MVLISTLLSLRTKDEVTHAASARLFSRADSARDLARLDETTIAGAIYPAGFYPTKARRLREIARICRRVPRQAPETFHEALQMYWFMHLGTIMELNGWDAMNPGHLDRHLQPFYDRDLRRLFPEPTARDGAPTEPASRFLRRHRRALRFHRPVRHPPEEGPALLRREAAVPLRLPKVHAVYVLHDDIVGTPLFEMIVYINNMIASKIHQNAGFSAEPFGDGVIAV